MSRYALTLLILLAVVGATMFALSRVDSEKPLTRVEKPVANDKLAR
ncbi:hypothetical protein [Sphingomonas flavalba]|nr:hypothetical protein [Sphingomonas flavalba]